MVVRLCCLLMVFVILIARISCSDVLDLDLANFEKLTKVASGHTTGDWLVKVLSRIPDRLFNLPQNYIHHHLT